MPTQFNVEKPKRPDNWAKKIFQDLNNMHFFIVSKSALNIKISNPKK